MNLLIDANLSYRLVKQIQHLFSNVLHVDRTGLIAPAADMDIWDWAVENDFLLLLTKDEDFVRIQQLRGYPPKLIVLRINNQRTSYVASILEKHFVAILELAADPEQGMLEIVGDTS